MRRPIARRKFSIRISVFFTSEEYTSDPTMGQKGTCMPNHVRALAICTSAVSTYLGAKLLGDSECQRCLTRARRARQQQCAARHLLGANQLHNHSTCLTSFCEHCMCTNAAIRAATHLAGRLLADEVGRRDGQRAARVVEAQASHVRMHRDALDLFRGLDLFDLTTQHTHSSVSMRIGFTRPPRTQRRTFMGLCQGFSCGSAAHTRESVVPLLPRGAVGSIGGLLLVVGLGDFRPVGRQDSALGRLEALVHGSSCVSIGISVDLPEELL